MTTIPNYTANRLYIPVEEVEGKVLKNKTPKRIIIGLKDGAASGSPGLIMPPFGTSKVSRDEFSKLDCEKWQQAGLIDIADDKNNKVQQMAFRVKLLLVLSLLATLDTLFVYTSVEVLKLSWENLNFSVIIFLFFNFGIVLFACSARVKDAVTASLRRVSELFWGLLLLSFALVLPMGLFIYYIVTIQKLAPTETVLGGLIVASIGMGTLLPGSFYFLFVRQSLETLRDTFFREVMMLDPTIKTIDESIARYGPKVEALYGAGKTGKLGIGTPLPVFFNSLLVLMGWLVIIQQSVEKLVEQHRNQAIVNIDLDTFFSHPLHPLDYGFLGAYFFGINMLFRRYVRADITPKAYSHFSLRIMVTTALVWTLSTANVLFWFTPEERNSLMGLIAFLIGVVPETGMALLIGGLKKGLGVFWNSDLLTELHPLSELEGITIYDQARLMEEGIENVENLAHADLVDLRLYTRIPLSRIVDLFDQAILYIHLGGDDLSQMRYTRTYLREYGIRTATDLKKAYLKEQINGTSDKFLVLMSEAYKYKQNRSERIGFNLAKKAKNSLLEASDPRNLLPQSLQTEDQATPQLPEPTQAKEQQVPVRPILVPKKSPFASQSISKTKQSGEIYINPYYAEDGAIKRLQVIMNAMSDDVWLWQLERWYDPHSDNHTIASPDNFWKELDQECGRCGKLNPIENNFCYYCGYNLHTAVVVEKI